MSVGQTSLDSLSDNKLMPQKCKWRTRPACFNCGVWLSKGDIDDKGNFQAANERVCAHCNAVNRLD